ncbi:hypothetical protein D3C85_1112770 [compost metagenome]
MLCNSLSLFSRNHGSAASTVIPSIPGAPWLRLTCLYARFRLSLSSMRSIRSFAPSLSFPSRASVLRAPAYSSRSTLSLCRQPFRYSAFITSTPLSVCTRDSRPVLWRLLTSHSKLYSAFGFFFSLLRVCEISPGKSDNFPLIYLPHLHAGIRAVLDFTLLSKLVRPNMPYM